MLFSHTSAPSIPWPGKMNLHSDTVPLLLYLPLSFLIWEVEHWRQEDRGRKAISTNHLSEATALISLI